MNQPNHPAHATDHDAVQAGGVFEQLETRKLMAGDVRLDFDADAPGTLADRDGQGTGFDAYQENEDGTGYRPALIDLADGLLAVTTSGGGPQGSNFADDNSHTNLLERRFDATGAGWTVTARLRGPFSDLGEVYKQSGVTVAGGQDDYAKLVLGYYPGGVRVEFADEYATPDGKTQRLHQSFADVAGLGGLGHLDLRITGDAAAGTLAAAYRTPGGDWRAAGTLTVPAAKRALFFGTQQRAGIIQSSRWASGSYTARYDHFEIDTNQRADPEAGRPTVTDVSPADGATDVARDGGLFASIAPGASGGRIDGRTLDATTVRLIDAATGGQVAANVQTSGAGDVIVVSPLAELAAGRTYRLEITDGAKDILGNAVVPHTSTFTTTAAATETSDTTIAFDRVKTDAAAQNWTGVTFGPDGRLYATTLLGFIYRYDVGPDGALSNETNIQSVRVKAGGNRAILGMAFHPDGTPDNLVAYVTHGSYAGIFDGDAPEWSGVISRLSGPNLQTVDDTVTGLPRSVGDHLTNQPAFGPDGALYVSQAANTAMGAPDATWSAADGTPRPEQLLTAAILRVDVDAIGRGSVDVRTADTATPYDPTAAGAPVTIHATGVRNAYDLLWHSNGSLYAPTNGSGSGGNTPGGPDVPALTNVPEVQDDYLFRIDAGGYYGSPNPARGEHVLAGGNPTDGVDPEEVVSYPVGTRPDADFDAGDVAFNFGQRVSPNGAIEYRDDARTGSPFGGRLDGRIIQDPLLPPRRFARDARRGGRQRERGRRRVRGARGLPHAARPGAAAGDGEPVRRRSARQGDLLPLAQAGRRRAGRGRGLGRDACTSTTSAATTTATPAPSR